MRAVIGLAGTVCLALSLSARAESVADFVKVMDANNVSISCYSSHYAATWYRNGFGLSPGAERDPDKMAKNFLDAGTAALGLDPKNVEIRFRMGEALVALGRYREALEHYDALRSDEGRLSPADRAQLAYETADCQFGLGDRTKALATLEAFAALKIMPGPLRGKPHWAALCQQALACLKDDDLDTAHLPLSTDAKPFPEPQRAKYAEDFIPLGDVTLALEGIREDDARIRLLKRKLSRLGAKVGSSGYAISVKVSSESRVDRAEGYTLVTAKTGAEIRARDLQGALWGVVSFVQLVDPARRSVRVAAIADWPDTANRGYIGTLWNGQLEWTLFQKMNTVNVEGFPMEPGRYSPLRNWVVAENARRFREFGLDLYFRMAWISMDVKIPISEPWVYDYHLKTLEMFAAMGANVYWANDDIRYPVAEIDRQKGLNASDLDAPHLLRLYTAVKAKHPGWKLVYCPPYYWGPDAGASYPDDREKFLKSLRVLPQEIGIYWAGPRVKSYQKTPEQVKWFTDLTGHKPLVFQNGTAPHNLLSYITDETGWLDWWHYDGFFQNDIAGYHKNAFTPSECPQISSLADCLWNVKGYEMSRSIRRGVDQFLGQGLCDILRPGQEALAYFDKYKYGAINADILQENMSDLEAKFALAKACWEKAVAKNPDVRTYGAYERALGFIGDLLKSAKDPPDYLREFKALIGPARAFAEKDCGFNAAKGDRLYLPTDLTGGQRETYSDRFIRAARDQGRFVKFLRGSASGCSTTEFTFECDPFPAAGPYELVLCGLDDLKDAVCPLEIRVNDTVVYKGKSGFPKLRYGRKAVVIPFEVMKRYNRVRLSNLAPGDDAKGMPFVAINYILIRKSAQDK